MNEPGVNYETQFVFRRTTESFPVFVRDLVGCVPVWLLALTVAAVIVRLLYRSSRTRAGRTGPDPVGAFLWYLAAGLGVGLLAWILVAFFKRDNLSAASGGDLGAPTTSNSALWFAFTGGVWLLGSIFVVLMYLKDNRSVRWYWAAPLAGLRILVYTVLAGIFLLPACQKWERFDKYSRVVVLIDVSPSITAVSDDATTTKGKTRIGTIIDVLTDEKIAFLKDLLAKNPVFVYRFGTRLDPEAQPITAADPAWDRAEWEAFARYDFKPILLRGLSKDAAEQVRASAPWDGAKPGTADWATSWLARPVEETAAGLNEESANILKANRKKLEQRIDVAKAIVQGTNVHDSIAAAVDREAPNMVQGVIVLSDGRSNLGGDVGFAELKKRASQANIPIFTIAVGEDRQSVGIAITDIQSPDNTPPDEPWKVVVEADGVNLANQDVGVQLDLFGPNKDPKVDAPDAELQSTLKFQPGEPPHGQIEFVIDPKDVKLTKLTQEVKDASNNAKRVFREGAWSAVARINRDKREVFASAQHVRERSGIQVIKKPLRILLVASGPTREFQALRTLLVREVQEKRAELCVYIQNEGGQAGTIVQDVPPSRLLVRFPNKLDTTVKRRTAEPDAKEAEQDKERFYNLNEYDVIVAFDPDWSELTQNQAELLNRWVQEQGGGLIYVAGPLNSYQLARVEAGGRLAPVLDILPVVPADIYVFRGRKTPREYRRLMLHPLPGSDLLKLDETAAKDDLIAGWEQFFTDRDKYVEQKDLLKELNPRRGFLTTYPIKNNQTKPGTKTLADLVELDESGVKTLRPWLVTTPPASGWRTCYMGSGELYRLFGYDPPTGKEWHNRFWVQLLKYMAAKRNLKAARGRVLVGKEVISGATVRIQARVLDQGSKPYPPDGPGSISPRFRIVQLTPNGQEKTIGVFPMTAKGSTGEFDGYYQGQVIADPNKMPPGESRYRVIVDVPDSVSETLESEFMVKKSDPELDITRPDLAAMLEMASPWDQIDPRVPDKAKAELLAKLPKEKGVTKLAFRLADREGLRLIPECMITNHQNFQNRGPVEDLWDQGFVIPEALTSRVTNARVSIAYALLLLILLLGTEWLTRKMLRLA